MYKIKDISNITGIQPQTLRAWEKRHGILIPQRTDSKIRFYTEQDLVKLLNIAVLLEHGWRISNIAKLSDKEIQQEVSNTQVKDKDENVVVQLLIKALCTMDAELFLNVSDRIIAKEGLKNTYINYYIPFFERIGVMWLANTINPAQEHMISNLIRQKLIVEIDKIKVNVKPPIDYILFCRENEYHEISLLFYDFVLKSAGYNVVYLGQNVPTHDLIRIAQLTEPKKGLVTSVLSKYDQDSIGDLMKEISEETKSIIYIGGASFAEDLFKNNISLQRVETIL
jgi:DNA-binding transcriptional MerR regulator